GGERRRGRAVRLDGGLGRGEGAPHRVAPRDRPPDQDAHLGHRQRGARRVVEHVRGQRGGLVDLDRIGAGRGGEDEPRGGGGGGPGGGGGAAPGGGGPGRAPPGGGGRVCTPTSCGPGPPCRRAPPPRRWCRRPRCCRRTGWPPSSRG